MSCLVIKAAFAEGDFDLSSNPANGPVSSVCGSVISVPKPCGCVSSRMRVMADRWTPASTATTDPRDHPA